MDKTDVVALLRNMFALLESSRLQLEITSPKEQFSPNCTVDLLIVGFRPASSSVHGPFPQIESSESSPRRASSQKVMPALTASKNVATQVLAIVISLSFFPTNVLLAFTSCTHVASLADLHVD